ncbi:flavin reductase family protein [Nocardioides carbamazepini]|uniref:flavin reductase family protein n=1 Tax=Nocardioides carbamazepini TaxID=2854259 RepID=UPI00214A2AF3|nr:flavin reductase family protein [Nocardioides carbamazepini]MCR1782352.1 flavin reductase family protein [Nocardioides carbamazepini]
MTHVVSHSLADRFKAGFRRHAAGVAIVVGETAEGPVGATVSSVASVSAAPPLLSFSLARTSTAGPQLVGCDALSVFLLAASQTDLAMAYADRRAERFTAAQGWVRDDDGLVLPEAVATFRGRPGRVIPAGGSWLVLLEVDRVEPGAAAAPLVHHDRDYWTPAPLPGARRALRAVEG